MGVRLLNPYTMALPHYRPILGAGGVVSPLGCRVGAAALPTVPMPCTVVCTVPPTPRLRMWMRVCVVSTFVCTHPLTYGLCVVEWSYVKHMEATGPRYTHRWCVLGRTAHCSRSNSTRRPIARMPIRGRQYGRKTVHVDRPRYGHRVLRRIGELPITGSAHQEPPLRRGFSLCVGLDIRPSMS